MLTQAYNHVGIVRSYLDENDNAIDVNFHDASHHHAVHLSNIFGYNMAYLSSHALVMAKGADPEIEEEDRQLK